MSSQPHDRVLIQLIIYIYIYIYIYALPLATRSFTESDWSFIRPFLLQAFVCSGQLESRKKPCRSGEIFLILKMLRTVWVSEG